MNKSRKDLIKIEAHHCYKCGNAFVGKVKKTNHHAIPQFLKPERNIVVPICVDCHKEINSYTVQSIPQFNNINNFIKNMEAGIKKYKRQLEKTKPPTYKDL